MIESYYIKYFVIISVLFIGLSCLRPSYNSLKGHWNICGLQVDGRYSTYYDGLILGMNGYCSVPRQFPDTRKDGRWQRYTEDGQVSIIIVTENPVYNDTFKIVFHSKHDLYQVLVLENEKFSILLKRYPPPIGDEKSPGDDWPIEYVNKKSIEAKKEDI